MLLYNLMKLKWCLGWTKIIHQYHCKIYTIYMSKDKDIREGEMLQWSMNEKFLLPHDYRNTKISSGNKKGNEFLKIRFTAGGRRIHHDWSGRAYSIFQSSGR